MELVSALNEGTTFSSLAAPMMKTELTEGVFIVDVEGIFPSEPKEYVHASTFTSTPGRIFSFSLSAQATHAALTSLRASHDFDHLQKFQFHLKEEYGGFHQNPIQNFDGKKMHTSYHVHKVGEVCQRIWRCFHGELAGEGVFVKIDKRLIDHHGLWWLRNTCRGFCRC